MYLVWTQMCVFNFVFCDEQPNPVKTNQWHCTMDPSDKLTWQVVKWNIRTIFTVTKTESDTSKMKWKKVNSFSSSTKKKSFFFFALFHYTRKIFIFLSSNTTVSQFQIQKTAISYLLDLFFLSLLYLFSFLCEGFASLSKQSPQILTLNSNANEVEMNSFHFWVLPSFSLLV